MEEKLEISKVKELFKKITDDAETQEIPEEIIVLMIKRLDEGVKKLADNISDMGVEIDERLNGLLYPLGEMQRKLNEESYEAAGKVMGYVSVSEIREEIVDKLTEEITERNKETLRKAITNAADTLTRYSVMTLIRDWIFYQFLLKQNTQ